MIATACQWNKTIIIKITKYEFVIQGIIIQFMKIAFIILLIIYFFNHISYSSIMNFSKNDFKNWHR